MDADVVMGLRMQLERQRSGLVPSCLLYTSMADAPEGAVEGEIVKTLVAPAAGEKCERCWIYTDDIGSDAAHPTLCARCARCV